MFLTPATPLHKKRPPLLLLDFEYYAFRPFHSTHCCPKQPRVPNNGPPRVRPKRSGETGAFPLFGRNRNYTNNDVERVRYHATIEVTIQYAIKVELRPNEDPYLPPGTTSLGI